MASLAGTASSVTVSGFWPPDPGSGAIGTLPGHHQAMRTIGLRRRIAPPIMAKPAIISTQDVGSGTGDTTGVGVSVGRGVGAEIDWPARSVQPLLDVPDVKAIVPPALVIALARSMLKSS